MADFTLDSLRGGLDTFAPVSALPDDACTVAQNVEFQFSTLGERRKGTTAFSLSAAMTTLAANIGIIWSFYHSSSAELWVLVKDYVGVATPLLCRYSWSSGVWTTVAFPGTDIASSGITGALSWHGKLFLAYASSNNVDRLHVWDGTSLRRVGLAATAAPTVANTGVGAYPAIARFYRTRSVKRNGTTVLVRSEPSPSSTVFTPSGAGTAARVTRATLPGESETDWEVEASTDGVTFYRLSTIAAATTTYDDSALVATYVNNLQSDPLLTYSLIPSVKYLSGDDDRMLLGGSHLTTADASAIRWTPVGNDPSPGPDERLNLNTDPRVDLDGQNGGDLALMTRVVNGTLYAMKTSEGVYQLLRTGNVVGAYEAHCVTKARAAIPGSLVEANDEAGRPAFYFIDPNVGPMRAGAMGLQFIGQQVKAFIRPTGSAALSSAFGVYHADAQQVHYWINSIRSFGVSAIGCKLVLQTNLLRTTPQGDAQGGWSVVPIGDGIADAQSAAMFTTDFPSVAPFTPFISRWADTAQMLHSCGSGTTDSGTAYVATLTSRPFFLAGILNRHGVLGGALLGKAGSKVTVTAIRDFGKETKSVSADMTAVGSETHVIAQLDDLEFAELFALQLKVTDASPAAYWELYQLALREEKEQTA